MMFKFKRRGQERERRQKKCKIFLVSRSAVLANDPGQVYEIFVLIFEDKSTKTAILSALARIKPVIPTLFVRHK